MMRHEDNEKLYKIVGYCFILNYYCCLLHYNTTYIRRQENKKCIEYIIVKDEKREMKCERVL